MGVLAMAEPMTTILRPWHVVHSVHAVTEKLRDYLTRNGFESYYPQLRIMRPIPRKQLSRKQRGVSSVFKREVKLPLFPGYMFVHMEIADGRWHDVFALVGVRGILCAGDLPAPMAAGFVETLMGREVGGAIPGETPVRELLFKRGDRARMTEGPFAGFEGPIEHLDESDRARLLLDVFGRAVPVEVSLDDLAKV